MSFESNQGTRDGVQRAKDLPRRFSQGCASTSCAEGLSCGSQRSKPLTNSTAWGETRETPAQAPSKLSEFQGGAPARGQIRGNPKGKAKGADAKNTWGPVFKRVRLQNDMFLPLALSIAIQPFSKRFRLRAQLLLEKKKTLNPFIAGNTENCLRQPVANQPPGLLAPPESITQAVAPRLQRSQLLL